MKTGFQSLHPLTCFIYYIGVMIFIMVFTHPVFLITALCMMIVINMLHDGGKELRRWMGLYLVIGLFVLIVNPLFSHRGSHILGYFLDNPITLESILYGFVMMLSIMTILTAFVSYHQIVTPGKFLYLFSSVSPKSALLVMMAQRFVPLLRRRLQQISIVQRTRGVSSLQGPLKKRLRDGMKQLQVLLTWSLEEALQTADSMNARGYGTTQRSAYEHYVMAKRDRTLWVLMLTTAAICFSGWGAGYGKLTIYPRLESMALSPLEWLSYGCFCIFLAIPAVVEGRELLKWRFWK